MYALAIWDSRTNTLTLARDGIGIKPLFYAVENNSLYFSSEIKGILATHKFSSDTDPLAFYSYLSNGYTEPTKTLSIDTGEKTIKESTDEIFDVYRKMATMA